MSTFREVVYMILDQNKLSNDDAYIEPEHILFIISKLRAYLLTSKYQKLKSQLSNANLQTITVDLEPSTAECCGQNDMYVIRSKQKVPDLLLLNNYEGLIQLSTTGGCFNNHFNFVDNSRFPYVGHNRWIKHQVYATIGTDNYVYVKSDDPIILDLEDIQISAVFEDAEKAAKMIINTDYDECATDEQPCDVMDMEFPLEEGLIMLLVDHAVNVIYNTLAKPQDIKNSANDELGSVVQYLNSLLKDRYRRNQQTTNDE